METKKPKILLIGSPAPAMLESIKLKAAEAEIVVVANREEAMLLGFDHIIDVRPTPYIMPPMPPEPKLIRYENPRVKQGHKRNYKFHK